MAIAVTLVLYLALIPCCNVLNGIRAKNRTHSVLGMVGSRYDYRFFDLSDQ